MTDKDQRQSLRREMRQRRRTLSFEQQQLAAEQLCQHLSQQPLFLHSQHIAFYLANDGEIDPTPLLHAAWQHGKNCYLPVLAHGADNRLSFVRYDKHTPLIKNRFGIAEPDTSRASEHIAAADLDLVLMPLVAFDANGNRMGMGGGFYDRTFEFKQLSPETTPYLLGLAHSCQQTAQLHSEHWDIPVHAIATEAALIPAKTKLSR